MTGSDIGCAGKKGYRTYWDARRSSSNLNRKSESAHSNPYKCNNCGLYHVGNTMGVKHDAQRTSTSKHYRLSSEDEGLLRDGNSSTGWDPQWH